MKQVLLNDCSKRCRLSDTVFSFKEFKTTLRCKEFQSVCPLRRLKASGMTWAAATTPHFWPTTVSSLLAAMVSMFVATVGAEGRGSASGWAQERYRKMK